MAEKKGNNLNKRSQAERQNNPALHLKEKLNGSYVTLEDEDIKLSLENNPKEFAKRYIEGRYLFIDEAQYLKNISSKEFGIRKIEKTKVAFVPYFFI